MPLPLARGCPANADDTNSVLPLNVTYNKQATASRNAHRDQPLFSNGVVGIRECCREGIEEHSYGLLK